jgi:hypothetical protein
MLSAFVELQLVLMKAIWVDGRLDCRTPRGTLLALESPPLSHLA